MRLAAVASAALAAVADCRLLGNHSSRRATASGPDLGPYGPPPCGLKNGWKQSLYKAADGELCVPTCPRIGVYDTPCPELPASVGGARPTCVHEGLTQKCLLPCGNGCPTGMQCGSESYCVVHGERRACPGDPLVGTWQVNDAFGIKGVTVALVIHPPIDGCDGIQASMSYLDTKLEYNLVLEQIAGQLHVKYHNVKENPPYYHEGYYFPELAVLMEDLNFKSGRHSHDTSGVLLYRKTAA